MKRISLATVALAVLLAASPARLRSLPISPSSGEARRSAFGAKAAAQSSRSRLQHLDGVDELKSWFNAGQGHPRLILLLSPT